MQFFRPLLVGEAVRTLGLSRADAESRFDAGFPLGNVPAARTMNKIAKPVGEQINAQFQASRNGGDQQAAQASDLTGQQLAQSAPPGGGDAPAFLGLSPQMTGLQQRTAIATGGTTGGDPKYNDPATVDYYRNLAFRDFLGPGGDVLGQPTGVERQYTQGLGYDERGGNTTESFLNSLLRG